LEAEPQTTTVRDPVTGTDLKVVLDGGALVDWLRNQNYAALQAVSATQARKRLSKPARVFHQFPGMV
jgi:hypothetical protein